MAAGNSFKGGTACLFPLPYIRVRGADIVANRDKPRISRFAAADRLTLHIVELSAREYHSSGCNAPGCSNGAEFRIDGPVITRPYRTCRTHIAVATTYLIGTHLGHQERVDMAQLVRASRLEFDTKMAAILAELPSMGTADLTALQARLTGFVGGDWSQALRDIRDAVDAELRRRDTQD